MSQSKALTHVAFTFMRLASISRSHAPTYELHAYLSFNKN